jgi:UDP-N-acetylmuramoyl-tripeptide--D-alanyl-D-alanine ligase
MNLKETVNALGGVIKAETPKEAEFKRLVIDSRNVRAGDIFIGMVGEKADGNSFAQSALDNGASLVVMDNPEFYEIVKGNKVLVRDSLSAIKGLGAYKLLRYKGKKIAITGSMGKTSTKELISSVLRTRKRVYTAYGNYNNELGVAICAANLNMRTSYAVFEFGTNSPGEIEQLSAYIKPDTAVVTGIGHAHIGRMGSMEKLAEEKLSIVKGMNGGVLWAHESCRMYMNEKILGAVAVRYFGADMNADVILADTNRNSREQFYFTAVYKGVPYCFILNHPYDHFINNALAAIGIGFAAGLDYRNVMSGILTFKPVKGRGEVVEINGVKVIDDTYNAGFESIMSAVKNLSAINCENKYAIIGEMGEIEGFEEMLYLKLYKLAKTTSNIRFIFVGQSYCRFQETDNITVAATKEIANETVRGITEGLVLVKASRARRFEDFIEFIRQEKKKRAV